MQGAPAGLQVLVLPNGQQVLVLPKATGSTGVTGLGSLAQPGALAPHGVGTLRWVLGPSPEVPRSSLHKDGRSFVSEAPGLEACNAEPLLGHGASCFSSSAATNPASQEHQQQLYQPQFTLRQRQSCSDSLAVVPGAIVPEKVCSASEDSAPSQPVVLSLAQDCNSLECWKHTLQVLSHADDCVPAAPCFSRISGSSSSTNNTADDAAGAGGFKVPTHTSQARRLLANAAAPSGSGVARMLARTCEALNRCPSARWHQQPVPWQQHQHQHQLQRQRQRTGLSQQEELPAVACLTPGDNCNSRAFSKAQYLKAKAQALEQLLPIMQALKPSDEGPIRCEGDEGVHPHHPPSRGVKRERAGYPAAAVGAKQPRLQQTTPSPYAEEEEDAASEDDDWDAEKQAEAERVKARIQQELQVLLERRYTQQLAANQLSGVHSPEQAGRASAAASPQQPLAGHSDYFRSDSQTNRCPPAVHAPARQVQLTKEQAAALGFSVSHTPVYLVVVDDHSQAPNDPQAAHGHPPEQIRSSHPGNKPVVLQVQHMPQNQHANATNPSLPRKFIVQLGSAGSGHTEPAQQEHHNRQAVQLQLLQSLIMEQQKQLQPNKSVIEPHGAVEQHTTNAAGHGRANLPSDEEELQAALGLAMLSRR